MKTFAILLILAAILALAFLPAPKGRAIQGPATGLIVIDGDTIMDATGVPHRLIGFDTPETFRARCPEELKLGKRAKARLEELIYSGPARLVQSGKQDKYQRNLSTLFVTVRGKEMDVRDILIKEGLAKAYTGKTKRQAWC